MSDAESAPEDISAALRAAAEPMDVTRDLKLWLRRVADDLDDNSALVSDEEVIRARLAARILTGEM